MAKLSLYAVCMVLALSVTVNVGCMKCGEKAAQKAAETLAEKAMEKASGGKADIDVGSNVDISGLPIELRYPGATAKGRWTMTNEKGTGTVYSFQTADPAKTVAEFYKKALAGWKSLSTMESDNSVVMAATSPDEKQTVTATVGTEDGKTSLSIIYATK